MNTLVGTLARSNIGPEANRNMADAKMPEVQREHERLMGSLGRLVELQRQLSERLSPVRAIRPEPSTGAGSAPKEETPATDIGCRIRVADDAAQQLIQRTEEMLGDLEI